MKGLVHRPWRTQHCRWRTIGGATFALRRTLDPLGRVAGVSASGCAATSIAYSDCGQIAAVSNADAVVEYAYDILGFDVGYTLALADGRTFSRLLTRPVRHHDEQISSVANVCGAATNVYDYAYDRLYRPTVRNADRFAYNRRGEVASATVAGEASAYAYDGIGNFTTVTGGAVTNVYAANELNQYEEVSTGAATLEPTYTSNGELASFGDWTYAYDALSRLTEVRSNGVLVATNSYDHQGRRVRLVTPEASHTFFYDGWNVVLELVDHDGVTDRIEYYWGRDISGSLQGAGGVGGLLYLKRNGSIFVPFYDVYGNVMEYRAADGSLAAAYVYDAFGRTIAQSGPLADAFRFRYSTKSFERETGLCYYGKRFYLPYLCRWLTRDPMEEVGGLDLYCFCYNASTFRVDQFGLSPYIIGEDEPIRATQLDTTTWNTIKPSFGEVIGKQIRAHLTVLGGNLNSMPDASRHLKHFLDNTGTPLEIRFREMNRESIQARQHLMKELNDGLDYAERLASNGQTIVMVTPSETGASNLAGNWLFAVGEYTTWARASVYKCGDSFSMNWHFYFRDIYDWSLTNGLRGGLVSDREMALLHRYGKAREYEMNGRQFIHVEWKDGERINSGARVSGL